jgi:hypothetical protein
VTAVTTCLESGLVYDTALQDADSCGSAVDWPKRRAAALPEGFASILLQSSERRSRKKKRDALREI